MRAGLDAEGEGTCAHMGAKEGMPAVVTRGLVYFILMACSLIRNMHFILC